MHKSMLPIELNERVTIKRGGLSMPTFRVFVDGELIGTIRKRAGNQWYGYEGTFTSSITSVTPLTTKRDEAALMLADALAGWCKADLEIAREALNKIAGEYGPHTRAGAYASLALTEISLTSTSAA